MNWANFFSSGSRIEAVNKKFWERGRKLTPTKCKKNSSNPHLLMIPCPKNLFQIQSICDFDAIQLQYAGAMRRIHQANKDFVGQE